MNGIRRILLVALLLFAPSPLCAAPAPFPRSPRSTPTAGEAPLLEQLSRFGVLQNKWRLGLHGEWTLDCTFRIGGRDFGCLAITISETGRSRIAVLHQTIARVNRMGGWWKPPPLFER